MNTFSRDEQSMGASEGEKGEDYEKIESLIL